MGWTGPAAAPSVSRTVTTAQFGRLISLLSAKPKKVRAVMVRLRHAMVTRLNSLLSSTKRPRTIPPVMTATWNAAPNSSMVISCANPARVMSSDVNAEMMFVTAIEPTNAIVGARKPGVRSSSSSVRGYRNHSCFRRPLAISLFRFSSSRTCCAAESGASGGGP